MKAIKISRATCAFLTITFGLIITQAELLAQDSLAIRIEVEKAIADRDTAEFERLGVNYSNSVKDIASKPNAILLSKLVNRIDDPIYFKLIHASEKIIENDGLHIVEDLKWKIFEQYICRFNGGEKDKKAWDEFGLRMKSKYGRAGDEIVRRHYLLSLLELRRDTASFIHEVQRYLPDNADRIHVNDVNQFCWAIFEYSNDQQLLQKALLWMAAPLITGKPEFVDTYANLLFKLNRKMEAIAFERIVVKKLPTQEFQETLKRMERNSYDQKL